MNGNNRICVAGPIPVDKIITFKGLEVVKYGCITHPVIALAKLRDTSLEVIPLSHIRKQDKIQVDQLLTKYGVREDFVFDHHDAGDIIQLRFLDENHRSEKQLGFMNPIGPEDFQQLPECDIYIFSPITDFEVSIDTLRYVKKQTNGIIVFDAHGPTNSVDVNGIRRYQFWRDRDRWLPYIDVLKMNLEEANCSWFSNQYSSEELQNFNIEKRDFLDEMGEYIVKKGVKAVYITLDKRGCQCYFNDSGEVRSSFIPSMPVEEVIDTTGCGDSFGGGLAYGLIKHPGDYIRACYYAHSFGAQRTKGTTFDVFQSLEETEKGIRDFYGVTL